MKNLTKGLLLTTAILLGACSETPVGPDAIIEESHKAKVHYTDKTDKVKACGPFSEYNIARLKDIKEEYLKFKEVAIEGFKDMDDFYVYKSLYNLELSHGELVSRSNADSLLIHQFGTFKTLMEELIESSKHYTETKEQIHQDNVLKLINGNLKTIEKDLFAIGQDCL